MLKINPLIDLFFPGEPWEKRTEKIAALGFKYVETWKGADVDELKSMNGHGVELVSVVLNFATEAEVAPVNPANRDAFIDRIDSRADIALAAGCRQGIVTAGQQVPGADYATQRAALVDALAAAAEKVRDRGFLLNLEPLNTEVDHAGYMLWSPADAVAIAKETGRPNVKILYDIYHMTIMIGNQTAFLRNNLDWIGHFHVAGVPGRHEPAVGETNYPFLLAEIDKGGYQGYIGLEYIPLLPSEESLKQTLAYFTL